MKIIVAIAVAIIGVLAACSDDAGPAYPVEQLQDPNTCQTCHPTHHTEWSGSMHAYSSTDPVFRAMHEKGQTDTNGALGMFCVNCHAPVAVANGTINLDNVKNFDFDTLAPKDNGITCFFCHNVERVTDDHNNPLQLAMDQTMRGGIKDPVSNEAHHSAYADLMDNVSSKNSSEMCGSCHDIVNPGGVHVERTFAEYKTTVFATATEEINRVSCGGCHMEPTDGVVADAPGTTSRPLGLHGHTFPSIDLALNDFPQKPEQDAAVKSFIAGTVAIKGLKVPNSVSNRAMGGICIDQMGDVTVRVDSFQVGHNFPSGSAFDRRAWIEFVAYDAEVGGTPVFTSGVVPDGMDPEEINDPKLAGFWDRAKKSDGSVAHYLWEVASIDDDADARPGKKDDIIYPAVTLDPNDPLVDHSTTTHYKNLPISTIQRMEARLLVRPLNYALLRELVAEGYLDQSVVDGLQTLVVSTSTWLASTQGMGAALGTRCNPN